MKNYIILFPLIFIFFLPLTFVLFQVANGLTQSSLEYFTTSQFSHKLFNSIVLSLGVSISSLFFALISTITFFSSPQRWTREILSLLLFMFFFISPIIYLTALSKLTWFNHLSTYTQSLSVLTIKFFPLVSMILILSLVKIESNSIRVALMITSSKNVFKYIVIPQLYKPLITAFLIVFMLTFIHQEVPSFLGYRTYAEEFLSRIVVMDNIGEISFMTIPFVLLSFLILGILTQILNKQLTSNSKSSFLLFQNFQKYTFPVIITFSALFLFLNALLVEELFQINIKTLFIDNFSVLKNSFIISFFTGLLGSFFSLLVYRFIYSNNSKYIKSGLILFMLLYWLLPSSLSSLGLIELSIYLNDYSKSIGYILLIFAYLLKIVPIALLFLISFELMHSPDMFLKLQNINTVNIFKHITVPTSWTTWFTLTIVLTVFSLNELSSTVLLIPPGEETLIIKIYNLMHYGDFASVSFLSLIQMSLILLSTLLIGFLLRSKYDYA